VVRPLTTPRPVPGVVIVVLLSSVALGTVRATVIVIVSSTASAAVIIVVLVIVGSSIVAWLVSPPVFGTAVVLFSISVPASAPILSSKVAFRSFQIPLFLAKSG
jgi:hypothetical protein